MMVRRAKEVGQRWHPSYEQITISHVKLMTLPDGDNVIPTVFEENSLVITGDKPGVVDEGERIEGNAEIGGGESQEPVMRGFAVYDMDSKLVTDDEKKRIASTTLLTYHHRMADIISRHGTLPINTAEDPDYWIRAFPLLFPIGQARFSDRRRGEALSWKEWIRHVLFHCEQRFVTHPTFIFHMFGVWHQRMVNHKTRLVIEFPRGLRGAEQFRTLTSGEVKELVEVMAKGTDTHGTDVKSR